MADAIIDTIKTSQDKGDFDVSAAVSYAIGRALRDGLDCGLGEAIVSAVEIQLFRSIESCVGSKEMADIVSAAVCDGVSLRKS